MWIFLSGGLVMPVTVALKDRVDEQHTLGYRDLQIRGRLAEHLEQFIADFMDPHGLDHSEIVLTPDHDYTSRFYTTKEAFGLALGHAVTDIDYRHFKDTSETRKDDRGLPRYRRAHEYHRVLLSIWSATLNMGTAGSFYGPWSKDNPNGYRPRRKASRGSSSAGWSAFGEVEEDGYGSGWFDSDDLYQTESSYTARDLYGADADYTPESEARAANIFEEVRNLPVHDWQDELTSEEFNTVVDYVIKYHESFPEQVMALSKLDSGVSAPPKSRRGKPRQRRRQHATS